MKTYSYMGKQCAIHIPAENKKEAVKKLQEQGEKRIEKILSSGVIKAITYPDFSYDITHFRFFTFKGVDDKGEYLLIGYIAEDTSEKNAIVNGKKCSVFDLDLFADNKVVEHLD